MRAAHSTRYPSAPSVLGSNGSGAASSGSVCAFFDDCIDAGCNQLELAELQCLVEQTGSFRAGEHVFRAGDPFRAIFAVRRGMVKTRRIDNGGREQVLGFYLPGEMIGLDAVYAEQFSYDAVALQTTSFCRFPFPAMGEFAARAPAVQRYLFRMLSRDLGTASLLAGDHAADARVAAFLMDLSIRYAARGLAATRFQLGMSRVDIANYLRLAAETVSRVFSRFDSRQLIKIDGRELELLDQAQLCAIGQSLRSG